jgi:hypothetical protein
MSMTLGLHGDTMWHAINDKYNIALLEYDGVIKLVNMDMTRTHTGFHRGACIRTLPLERVLVFFPSAEDVIVAYCGLQDYRC